MTEHEATSTLDASGNSVPDHLRDELGSVLISRQEIEGKLAELAARIDEDYAGKSLLLVGVLKGAFVVMADLVRHLTIDCAVDFMACSSYGSSTKSSGVVRILKDLDTEIEGRHVLVVEDIVDSGLTLQYLMRNLQARNPASIEVLALLTKPSRHRVDVPMRYLGFEVDDTFVVGYGLDFDERYRNLPFIAAFKGDVAGA